MEFEVTARAYLTLSDEQAAKVKQFAKDYRMSIAEVLADQSAGWWRDFEELCDIDIQAEAD
jgi:hypothetical protein